MEIAHKGERKLRDLQDKEKVLYEVLNELPKPDAMLKLSASQKKFWYWFGVEFVKTKQFSKVDLMHLHSAAIWMDARCNALKKVNQLNRKDKYGIAGWVQKFSSGATNVTGYVSIMEKADKHLNDVSAHFGLSLRDRKKIGAVTEGNKGQLSMYEELFKQLHG